MKPELKARLSTRVHKGDPTAEEQGLPSLMHLGSRSNNLRATPQDTPHSLLQRGYNMAAEACGHVLLHAATPP